MDSGLALRAPRNDGLKPMDARDHIKIGMSAERTLVVPPERTVGHFVAHMPMAVSYTHLTLPTKRIV